MSASAGRVLIIPKGAWSSSETYNMLDAVSYQGSMYIAKRQNTGVTPVDGADWFLSAQGTAGAQVLSFNGRTGNVTPANTDYGISMMKDVALSSLANKQKLKYNSTTQKFENVDDVLSGLNDVNISSLANGQVLVYNSTSQKWENGTPANSLSDLSDATITTPADKQLLQYNGTSSKWENKALYKKLTATLTAGQTTITFTDNFIVSDSMCELQVVGGMIIAPTAITDNSANHSVTYTFDAQDNNVSFKLLVLNI